MKELDPSSQGYVTFDAFLNFMAQEQSGDDEQKQMVESFKTIAGEKVSGYIYIYVLRIAVDNIRHAWSPKQPLNCCSF